MERSGRLVVRKGGAETRAIPSILNLIQSTIRNIKKGQAAALRCLGTRTWQHSASSTKEARKLLGARKWHLSFTIEGRRLQVGLAVKK